MFSNQLSELTSTFSSIWAIRVWLYHIGQGLAWIFNDDSLTRAAPLRDGALLRWAFSVSKSISTCFQNQKMIFQSGKVQRIWWQLTRLIDCRTVSIECWVMYNADEAWGRAHIVAFVHTIGDGWAGGSAPSAKRRSRELCITRVWWAEEVRSVWRRLK